MCQLFYYPAFIDEFNGIEGQKISLKSGLNIKREKLTKLVEILNL